MSDEIKVLFKKYLEGSRYNFWIPSFKKNDNRIFIEFSNSINRVLTEKESIFLDELFDSNSNEGLWFTMYLLNFIEQLPLRFLNKLLTTSRGYVYPNYILSGLLSNLVRLYTFGSVEKSIQKIYQNSLTYLDKYFVLFLFYRNIIDHQYGYENNKINVFGKSQYSDTIEFIIKYAVIFCLIKAQNVGIAGATSRLCNEGQVKKNKYLA